MSRGKDRAEKYVLRKLPETGIELMTFASQTGRASAVTQFLRSCPTINLRWLAISNATERDRAHESSSLWLVLVYSQKHSNGS